MKALMDLLYLSIRLRHACVRSTGDASRRRSRSDASLIVNAAKSDGAAAETGIIDHAVTARLAARNSLLERYKRRFIAESPPEKRNKNSSEGLEHHDGSLPSAQRTIFGLGG